MKRTVAIIMSLVMLVIFASCRDNSSNTESVATRDNSYKITAQKYETSDSKINVSYPEISGLYDEKMQKYYNDLFKSDFEGYMNDEFKGSFENTYQVTHKSEDVLSIVFRCSVYNKGSAHPLAFSYAYNINLETGETFIPSADIDMDSVSKTFLKGKNWTIVRADEGVEKSDVIKFYKKSSADEIKDFLTETDVFTVRRSEDGVYSTEGSTACRSYLDDSSTPVFILDVTHASGYYVDIKFN